MQQNGLHNHLQERGDGQEGTRLTDLLPDDASACEFKAGDVIDSDYQVLRWIGAGGMGNVYCVRHSMMQQEYALKTLSADKVTDVAWRRFQNEAQAIARMQHPSIVAVYNLGLHDSRLPYYVMDLLKGRSLMEILRDQGPMDLNLTLGLFAELCGAFGYAHKKGIVHRDIKPANIMLLDVPEASCRAKIVDFGIAKLSGIKDPKNQFLTNIGEICGSPYYMSPEQSLGQRIDARSDIYSLGCTLFEVLTGVPPLRGRNALETMLQHQTVSPPTLQTASGGKEFPEMLESVVATLLAKAPMDRYQTMELVAQDLNTILAGTQTVINPYSSHAPRPVSQARTADKNGSTEHRADGRELSPGHRRQYDQDGAEVSDDNDEDRSENSHAQVIMTFCALSAVVLLMAAGGFWWLSRSTAKISPGLLSNPTETTYLNRLVCEAKVELATVDKMVSREQINSKIPTISLKEKKPFSHIETSDGGPKRVFEFPSDIIIGNLQSEKQERDSPATGTVHFHQSEKIALVPDRVLLKYPQYLARFQPGDIDCIKLDDNTAKSEMFKHICQLTGVARLELSDCPNITAADMRYIDKMDSLVEIGFYESHAPAATLSHLSKLNSVARLDLDEQEDCADLLKLIKDSPALEDLSLPHSKVNRRSFEYIAQIPDLKRLSLDEATFSGSDLQLLARAKTLQTITLEKCKIDQNLVSSLRTIASLRQVAITAGHGNKMSVQQIHNQLPGILVESIKDTSDALPDKL